MNNLSIAADAIKNSVSALDVADALGWEVKHGRCRCPIHGGTDMNCKLYPGNRGYMCWVCKSAGDVISLVRNYYHDMNFKQCLTWFNDTFRLGLDLESKIDPAEARRAEIALKMRKEAHELETWKGQMRFDLFLLADRILEMLEEQRDLHVPKTPNETWDPKFCEAIRVLPAARRFAENCLSDCVEVRNE